MSVSTSFINYRWQKVSQAYNSSIDQTLIDTANSLVDTNFVNKIGVMKTYTDLSINARTAQYNYSSGNWYEVRYSSSSAWSETTNTIRSTTNEGRFIFVSDNGVDVTDDTANLIGKAVDIGDTWQAMDTTGNLDIYVINYDNVYFFVCPYYNESTSDGVTSYIARIKFRGAVKVNGSLKTTKTYDLLCGSMGTSADNYYVWSQILNKPLPTLVFTRYSNYDYFGVESMTLNLKSDDTYGSKFYNHLVCWYIYTVNGSPIEVTEKTLEDVIGTNDEPDDGLTGYDLDKVRDGGSDTIPIPDVSYINSVSVLGSLLKVYSITNTSLATLAGELWSQTLIDQLYKTMTNPMSCIVNLRLQPISSNLAVTSENLHIGNYVSAASGNRIDTNAYQLDLGSLKCYMFFDNYIDYAPYTKVSLYLPFVGVVPLDVNEAMNSTLSVKYNVDMYSGSAVAYVHATRTQNGTTNNNLIGSYRCNLAFNIPLTSEVNNSLLNTFATFTNPSSYVNSVGTISNMATTQILNSPTVQKSSGLSSNVGYMGVMYPYLIVERPIDYSDSKCLQYQGYDTLKVTTLSSGFNKYKSGTIKVTDDSLTETEIVELKTMLSNGVII